MNNKLKCLDLYARIINFDEDKEYLKLWNTIDEHPIHVWPPIEYSNAIIDIANYVNDRIISNIIQNDIIGYSNKSEKEINKKIEEVMEDINKLIMGYQEDLEELRKFIKERNEENE